MICEASMVSPRTLFNYFGSKEGAILGAPPALPSDDDVEAFARREGGDVLGDFVALVASTLVGREPDPELFRRRRLLMQGTPELLTRQMVRMGELEAQFVRIVMTRFRVQGRDAGSEPDLEDEARMLVALATGVLRYTMRKWISGDSTGTLGELLATATGLAHKVTATAPTTFSPVHTDPRTPHV